MMPAFLMSAMEHHMRLKVCHRTALHMSRFRLS